MDKKEKMLVYAAVFAAVFVLVSGFYSAYYPGHTQANYERAISAQLDDKCATPPGYTDEQWRVHMSHHPDIYGRCL